MFNIVCVTHRKLCENFFKRVGELYKNNVPVILREKDLSESEYEELAKKVIEICPNVILHSYINVAKKIGVKRIHLPLRLMNENAEKEFETVGVSVHSAPDCVRVARQTLTLFVWVQILVGQPNKSQSVKIGICTIPGYSAVW